MARTPNVSPGGERQPSAADLREIARSALTETVSKAMHTPPDAVLRRDAYRSILPNDRYGQLAEILTEVAADPIGGLPPEALKWVALGVAAGARATSMLEPPVRPRAPSPPDAA